MNNPEHLQQLYGGDVGDYAFHQKPIDYNATFMSPNDQVLGDIYSSQIKPKGSIDTSGIYRSANVPLQSLIERQPDKFEQMLSDTLTQIAKIVDITNNTGSTAIPSLTPKEQTQADLAQAQDNVAQAMKELAALGAI